MLPVSGPIGLADIALELGHGGKDIGLHIITAGGDKYVNVNGSWEKICKCSYSQPLHPAPFSIFDWYGYDHSAQGVTGVDIVGKTAVLPGEIVPYEALINGPNQIGITLLWETYNGSSWSVAGYGASINITWGSNPSVQKLRLTVQGQCQGGESVKQVNITQKGTYYNLISCNTTNNVIRQTITPISTEGQNVFWGDESIHFWDGTVTDVATDYIGEVSMGVGTYCGGSAPTIYRILERCSDGTKFCTTSKIGRKYQRVKDGSDVTYWYTGEIARTAIYSTVTVTIVPGKVRCVDPVGDPLYYNLAKCGGGPDAQTSTPISAANMRVFAGAAGVYVSTGDTTTSPTNDIGEVNLSGAWGCDDGGSSGGGVYSQLYRCADGALYYTTKTFATSGQKVSTPLGEMYFTGQTTNSPGTVIAEIDITVLANQTGCAGSGGSTTYYQVRRCGTQEMYYTATNPGTPGQRVASVSAGYLVYTGGTTTTPPNNIGVVTPVSGEWGCEGEGSGTVGNSTYRKDMIQKLTCELGYYGSYVEVEALEGQFFSEYGVGHANTLRDLWMHGQANELGTCTLITNVLGSPQPPIANAQFFKSDLFSYGGYEVNSHVSYPTVKLVINFTVIAGPAPKEWNVYSNSLVEGVSFQFWKDSIIKVTAFFRNNSTGAVSSTQERIYIYDDAY